MPVAIGTLDKAAAPSAMVVTDVANNPTFASDLCSSYKFFTIYVTLLPYPNKAIAFVGFFI